MNVEIDGNSLCMTVITKMPFLKVCAPKVEVEV